CGRGMVRPDVVWFGEALPPDNLERAFLESQMCDVMLVVGTSGVVYPAAHLPLTAKNAFLIEVNPTQSELTSVMDIHLAGPSGEVLPQLVLAVRQLLTD